MSSDENDLIKAEAARYKRATDAAAKSRAALTELVIDALREPNAKPADIARRADWTSAYVRKLARENGIQADPAYQARTQKARERVLAEAGAAQASARPGPSEQPMPGFIPHLPVELGLEPQIRRLTPAQVKAMVEQVQQDHPEWARKSRRLFASTLPTYLPYVLANDAFINRKVELPAE
jgi:hypothetical protein